LASSQEEAKVSTVPVVPTDSLPSFDEHVWKISQEENNRLKLELADSKEREVANQEQIKDLENQIKRIKQEAVERLKRAIELNQECLEMLQCEMKD